MTTLRALIAALNANPSDHTCPRALADYLYEQLGDRMAALRIVVALQRVARRHSVARAARLITEDGDMRALLERTLIASTEELFSGTEPIVVVPGRRQVCVRDYPCAESREPGAIVICGYTLRKVLRAWVRRPDAARCLVVGASTVIALARGLGLT